MDELTMLRQLAERQGPAQVMPGPQVEASIRARTGALRPRRTPRLTSRRMALWAAPLAAAATVAAVALAGTGVLTARESAPAATAAGRDLPDAGGYVYTRMRFVEPASGTDGYVTGVEETWATADGHGAVLRRSDPHEPGASPGRPRAEYDPEWTVVSTEPERAGTPGWDYRGDLRFPMTGAPMSTSEDCPAVPALPNPATRETVETWLAQIERAGTWWDSGKFTSLSAPTCALGFGAVTGFALVPTDAREGLFQALAHRPGVRRMTVPLHDGRQVIAFEAIGNYNSGYPWDRMLFDPASHAFIGTQAMARRTDTGTPLMVGENVIVEQRAVDRPGRLPNGTQLSWSLPGPAVNSSGGSRQ